MGITNLLSLFNDWNEMTDEEKIEQAKKCEQEHAKYQSRDPVIINFDRVDKHFGLFQANQNTIFIHPALLKTKNPYGLLLALLHEGRHAYQHTRINENRSKVSNIWKINASISGYLGQKPDYGLQPIELDAYRYSLTILSILYETVKDNPTHQDFPIFIELQKKLFNHYIEDGKKRYGNHYPEIINRKILMKHHLFLIAQQKLQSPTHSDLLKLSDLIEGFINTPYPDRQQAFKQLVRGLNNRTLLKIKSPDPHFNRNSSPIIQKERIH